MDLFMFTLDGFRIIQVAMTVFVFLCAVIFSGSYFKGVSKEKRVRNKSFYVFTAVTFFAVIGVFLSANLITLFTCFEVMSFASFGLVIDRHNKRSLETAKFYLAVSVISGMIMLLGLFFLQNVLGTLEISMLQEASSKIEDKGILYLACALTLVGFGTKAAMFPLHFWLSKTYCDSPAPATAIFSSVLSKAGVFGIIIVSSFIMMGQAQWGNALIVFSLITMLVGGFFAIKADDIKKTVAYSSMSQIGFILFGISMSNILVDHNTIAARGIVLHMLNHSVFKLGLFTICGIALIKYSTTRLKDIKGLGRRNKIVGVSFVALAAGLAGIPGFSGYVSKTLLHESVVEYLHLHHETLFMVYEYLFLIAGGFTLCYMLKIGVVLFSKPEGETSPIKLPFTTSLVIVIPALYSLILGLTPNLTLDAIADFGTDFMHVHELSHQIDYFSFVNLQGSIISISLGLAFYFIFSRVKFIKAREAKSKKVYKNSNAVLVFTLKIFDEFLIKYPLKLIEFVISGISTLLDRYVFRFFVNVLFFIVSGVSFICSSAFDFIMEKVIKVILKPAKERDATGRVTFSHKAAEAVDQVLNLFRIKHRSDVVDTLVNFEKQSAIRRRMISASLSYGLLFAGIGLISFLLYMLLS